MKRAKLKLNLASFQGVRVVVFGLGDGGLGLRLSLLERSTREGDSPVSVVPRVVKPFLFPRVGLFRSAALIRVVDLIQS
jgi:hypothetical protein